MVLILNENFSCHAYFFGVIYSARWTGKLGFFISVSLWKPFNVAWNIFPILNIVKVKNLVNEVEKFLLTTLTSFLSTYLQQKDYFETAKPFVFS